MPPTAHLTFAVLRARRHLNFEAIDEGIQRHCPQILAGAGPHGHLLSLQLLVAQDHQIRQLLQAMYSKFLGNFLITQIRNGPEAGALEALRDRPGVVGLTVGYGQDDHLLRREP